MSPYNEGRRAARWWLEQIEANGFRKEDYPVIYLDPDEWWPEAGPYTWDQYIKGAKSLLGEHKVAGGRLFDATPQVFAN